MSNTKEESGVVRNLYLGEEGDGEGKIDMP